MTSKKIYKGFDLVKLLAAIGIIAVHTRVPFLNILGRLGVPFFALVSSILFFQHYQKLLTPNSQNSYLKKFCMRIMTLYLAWQVLYLPLAIRQFVVIMKSLGGVSLPNILRYLLDFIFPAIYNPQNVDLTKDANGWGPSWYLLAAIVAMPVLVGLLRTFAHHQWVPVVLCGLIELYLILADEFGGLTNFTTIFNHTFLRLLIYFCVGYLIVTYQDQLLRIPLHHYYFFFAICLVLFFIENLLVHHFGGLYNAEEVIMTVPTGFCLTMVAMKVQPPLQNSTGIRQLSTFLYCLQIWPIEVLRKVFEIIGWTSHYVLLFVVVMAVSLLAYYCYDRCRQKFGGSYLASLV